jgi:hypothetical protein
MLRTLAEIDEATAKPESPRLVVDAPGGRALMVAANEGRLVQVLRNLLANAMSFSPPRGSITLFARREGRRIRLSVADQGPGIPSDKLDAIFDRFYTERPAGEKFGTHSGLGLSISRQIVEAHGGRLFAENLTDPDGSIRGARFAPPPRHERKRAGPSRSMPAAWFSRARACCCGRPGAGKSDLALRLVDGGGALVADDLCEIRRAGSRLFADLPTAVDPAFRGRIALRGIGFLTLPYAGPTPLAMVAALELGAAPAAGQSGHEVVYLGIALPLIVLDPFQASAAAKLRLLAKVGAGAIMRAP